MPEPLFEVEVEGLDELAKFFDEVPYIVATNIMRSALQAAGQVMQQGIQAYAPVADKPSHRETEPGELRESIIVETHLGKDLDENYAIVGPRYDKSRFSGKDRTHSPGVYGSWEEFGTSKAPAQPFMRPGFEATKEQAFETFLKVSRELFATYFGAQAATA
jgi:HK97 gp10 family phage protein